MKIRFSLAVLVLHWVLIFLPEFSLASEDAPQDAGAVVDNGACLRCHRMTTLGYRDKTTGHLVNLAIDNHALQSSSHKKLACSRCHSGEGYDEFPHEPPEATDGSVATAGHKSKRPRCPDCHQKEPKFQKYRFEKIARQVEKSVHHGKASGFMGCFSCHDPHNFQVGSQKSDMADRVKVANQICLSCHAAEDRVVAGVAPALHALKASHRWLPNTERHWKVVRCVDCHTPKPGTVIHTVLPAKQANRACVACHTGDSILLSQLYRHQMLQERQKGGFINSMVMNDAYIIGMTRNRWLDIMSVAMLALTLAGLAAHGFGRWLAAKKRKNTHV